MFEYTPPYFSENAKNDISYAEVMYLRGIIYLHKATLAMKAKNPREAAEYIIQADAMIEKCFEARYNKTHLLAIKINEFVTAYPISSEFGVYLAKQEKMIADKLAETLEPFESRCMPYKKDKLKTANKLLRHHQEDEALERLKQISKQDSDYAQALYAMADIYLCKAERHHHSIQAKRYWIKRAFATFTAYKPFNKVKAAKHLATVEALARECYLRLETPTPQPRPTSHSPRLFPLVYPIIIEANGNKMDYNQVLHHPGPQPSYIDPAPALPTPKLR